MSRYLLFVPFLLLTYVATAFQITPSWEAKVAPSLLAAIDNGSNQLNFIILLQPQADLRSAATFSTKLAKGQFVFQELKRTAQESQTSVRNYLEAQGMSYHPFYIINAIQAKGTPLQLQQLAQEQIVKRIIANSPYQLEAPVLASDNAALTPQDIEWGIQMIGADQVWDMGYTGQGVVVGGQDTGYDWEHPALKTKYRGYIDENNVDHNYNWHDAIHEIDSLNGDPIIDPTNNPCGLDVDAPCDDNNHGTHTMGTMVGTDGGENQIGVAPDARWVGCRNMERGWGSPASYIECFEWLMAPTDLSNENPNPALAPHVFANSWGCPPIEGCDTSNFSIMETVVNTVKSSGVMVVVSAGNSGSECSTVNTPAAIFENSFSVGATRMNDTIAGFSSRGPVLVDGSMRMKPDISAPGHRVRSSVLGDQYSTFSGTSMAGPHVVGVVALIISANPQLAGQVDIIEDIIIQSAVPKTTDQDCGNTSGTAVPNNTYGHGRINALAAVQLALTATPTQDLTEVSPISVYPNPFTNTLQFDLTNLSGISEVTIFNGTGQNIGQWQLEGAAVQTLTVPQLANGIYFYHLKNKTTAFQGKILKGQ